MRNASTFGFLAAALASLPCASALALTQPDNTTIPQDSGLQGLFSSRGEAIDALAEASTTPETFVPGCALTFEVLQRNAGYKNSFGWYNVTGAKPADAELHEFLTCNDDVGAVKTLNIKLDPAYAGGEVGFYQATGNCATIAKHDYIFFSEKGYNPDGNAANPYIHLLIYNSTVTPKAFYFGWEDLLSGGDNDFDDLTTFVTGISCTGGGGACQTGLPGVCGAGTLQCQGGALTCVQQSQPTGEACDGVDNDCDGTVDQGDLCPETEVCDQGTCVPACNGAEFPCPEPEEICSPAGYCVDPGCLEITCQEGTKCVEGACVAPCDGVVCPQGQACIVGVCLDPCVGIQCDAEQVCVAGACVDHCGCAGCVASDTCQSDGLCIPTPCLGLACDPGFYCDASGACVDACAGATCPGGQICQQGQCVEAPAGSGAGGMGQGGSFFNDGGGGSGGATTAGGASSGQIFAEGAPSESTCGCRVAGGPTSHRGLVIALAAAGVALGRRRQRPPVSAS